MKNNDVKFTLPMLAEPRTLRVRFRKVGNLQYISHLDLQRTFSRVLVRAGLPLWYTKGFNPHIKMVFGMPLPVGSESECEMLDIRIEREMSCDEVKARLNAELTDELAVLEVYPAVEKFTAIAFAEYEYTIVTTGADAALAARMDEVLQGGGLTVTKKSKSGEKEIDLSAYILSSTVSFADGLISICAKLSAAEGKYISPEALITALRRETGILSGDPTKEHYRILRRRALLADGKTEFR
jgi:radical SAM-linked protein